MTYAMVIPLWFSGFQFTMPPTRYLPKPLRLPLLGRLVPRAPADAKLDELHRHLLHRKAPVLYHRTAVGAAIPLAEQEGEEHVPPPARHGQHLVQVGPGEHHRAARSGPIEVRPVLGETQMPALVPFVQVQGQRESPVLRRRAQVVPVRPEMPALGCIVAGDLEPLEPRRPERERLANLRHHPAPNRGGQAAQQLRILNRVVPPPLRFRIEPVLAPPLAGPLDAGLDAP